MEDEVGNIIRDRGILYVPVSYFCDTYRNWILVQLAL
jgi:hypothetical protein